MSVQQLQTPVLHEPLDRDLALTCVALVLVPLPGAGHHAAEGEGGRADLDALPELPLLLALLQFIEADVQQARDQLQAGIGLAVGALAGIGGDGLEAILAQRRGEAFG
ncbi:MAG TPA: hypothetical protein VFV47_11075, partial [Hyphomicrobiaceae bacterium]|nr:hypothetical protein [Hyphomicrobiaceae bacterium]